MYDPTIGQFLSEDPLMFEGLDENLRRYVKNRPTMLTDPNGLKPVDDVYAIPSSDLLIGITPPRVTSDNLGWEHFNRVDRPPEAGVLRDAATMYYMSMTEYDYKVDTIVLSSPPSSDCYTVMAFVRPRNLSFSAIFSTENSWVLRGSDRPSLLEHERLHLRIAEHFAAYATSKASGVLAESVASAPTYEEARAKAISQAKTIIDKQVAAMFDALMEKSGDAQSEYDDQTDGGDMARRQRDWELNWQRYVRPFQW